MGGKDSNHASARVSRETTFASSHPSSSRSGSSTPFYRQFLPAQLSSISANDPIPSLDDLSALAKHLTRIKNESTARLSRLESRAADPLKPIFVSNPNDLFSPPGLSSTSLNLYSDSQRQIPSSSSSSSSAAAASKQQRSRERTFNLTSPVPPSLSQPNGSPTSSAKNKLKIKRERDNDSAPATSSALYSDARSARDGASHVGGKAGIVRSKAARGYSLDVGDDESVVSTDPDWDLDEDSIPSRPGRTYGKNKKRKRKDATIDSQEDESGSEFEASSILGGSTSRGAPGATSSQSGATKGASTSLGRASAASSATAAMGAGSRRGSEVGLATSASTPKMSTFGMRLKVNPATGASSKSAASKATSHQSTPGLQRKASDGTQMSTRRNSIMPSPSPSTPMAQATVAPAPFVYAPAPGWELPARTPESFLPTLEPSRLPRTYPTKPQEVNENFADKDWKEKERERDRLLERESVGPGTPGVVGAGQSMVKEATTGRRGGRELQQTPIHTFYNYADAFFKTLTEDDLAWLSSKSDDHEPFQMPALGRHYKQVWAEEDEAIASGAVDAYGLPLTIPSRNPSFSMAGGAGLPIDPSMLSVKNGTIAEASSVPNPELEIAPPPHFKPKQMTDQHLGLESPAVVDARSGPLAERLVAALLPTKREDEHGMEEEGDEGGSRSNGVHINGHGASYGQIGSYFEEDEGGDEDADGEPDLDLDGVMHDQDMVGFEERIKKELKALEVLSADEEVDWATRADDEISTTLRMVQRELARQQKINEMRKGRLFQIAKDRMAYQDYITCLNSVEKEIETGWTKRLRQIKASLGKRKKGGHASAAAAAAAAHHEDSPFNASQGLNGTHSASGTPQPQANYNGPVRPQLPENLVNAMDRRQKLQYAFKDLFDEAKHAWQTPTESVYADLHLEEIE